MAFFSFLAATILLLFMWFVLCICAIPEQEFGLDDLNKGSPEFSVHAFMIHIIDIYRYYFYSIYSHCKYIYIIYTILLAWYITRLK